MASRGRGSRRRNRDDGWEGWGGYMNAKKQKLQEQFNHDKTSNSDVVTSNIFQGIAIFVNGYTKPSSDELKRLMMCHGGTYHHYYSRALVTHIIATNLPDNKIRELRDKKVVRPDWIMDSIKAGRCLPYSSYQLYTAQNRHQPALTFKHLTTSSSSNSDPPSGAESAIIEGKQDVSGYQGNNANDDVKERQNTGGLEDINDNRLGTVNALPSEEQKRSPTSTFNTSVSSLKGANNSTGQTNVKKSPAKAGDPAFVSEFYAHSRLHYISTWSAELKNYISRLKGQENPAFPGLNKLRHLVESENTVSADGVFGQGQGQDLGRVVMHIDMDCFFVSVGLRERPELKGKPVAVSHSKGKGQKNRPGADKSYEMKHWQNKLKRKGVKVPPNNAMVEERSDFGDDDSGEDDVADEIIRSEVDTSTKKSTSKDIDSFAEIASCSYEARKAGIKNGMFVGPAKKMCPNLEFIPYDFEKYREVSQQLYDVVTSYTHDIEAVSCDEMFVDCTEIISSTGATPMFLAKVIREEIFNKTKCNASAGLANNILLARMAIRVAKPNGQFYLDQLQVPEFIKKQPIRDLPGVGWSTAGRLQAMNVTTCADLQKVSLGNLQKEFGQKTGQLLYNNSRGLDKRSLQSDKERKSVSAEINYGIRFTKNEELEKFLKELSEEVCRRLKNVGVKGKAITLKLKVRKSDAPTETLKFLGHGVCDNVAKSSSLSTATDDPKVVLKECLSLFKPLKLKVADLRGIGIQMHKLESASKVQKGGILNYAKKVDKATTQAETTQSTPVEHNTQLARRKTAVAVLPPLPTFPSFDSSSDKLAMFSPPNSDDRGRRTQITKSSLPSPSQIDPEVLKELPPDIREQIMSTFKKPSLPQPDRSNMQPNMPEAQPGCSHWHAEDAVNVPAEEETHLASDTMASSSFVQPLAPDSITSSPIVALPSYSQIDPSCFDALPPELQEELTKAYKDQKNNSTKQPKILKLKQAPARKSPKKSPQKNMPISRTSPVFKVPRGRPAKVKKAMKPVSLDFSEPSSISSEEPILISSEVTRDLPNTSKQKEAVNLCGAVKLCDVKNLILEWLQSTDDPDNEDINRLVQYLSNLIQDKNMSRVDLLIKFLFRQVSKEVRSCQWKEAFDVIANNTQNLFLAAYGSKLKFLTQVLK